MTGKVWMSFTSTRRGYLIRTLDDTCLRAVFSGCDRLVEAVSVSIGAGIQAICFSKAVEHSYRLLAQPERKVCSYSLLKSI